MAMQKKKLAPYSMIEAVIQSPGQIEVYQPQLEGILRDCGIPEKDWVFFENEQKPYAGFYTRSFKKLQSFEKKFRKISPKGFKFRSRILERNDWFDKWQLDYQIMPIGDTFTLVPLWQKKKFKQGKRTAIYLDPKGASGSGQHPTTEIMIELIESLRGKFSDCLDLGTGTGILGIALAKLGAAKIDALDNDEVAVESAKFNFELNQVPDWRVWSEDVFKIRKVTKYSLVCANLISSVLDKVRSFLFASVKPGGYLLVSGIHVQNFPVFKKSFHHPQFRCLRILRRRGWTGLLFRRSASR